MNAAKEVVTKSDLSRYKREMKELREELNNKRTAIRFLKNAGIITSAGHLSKQYQ